tara:strand:+ start:681 stop:1094 length:414 start_codon:yes stop_codon:yes gene_type:complete
MLSSLLRPKKARRRVEESPLFSSPYAGHAAADFTEDDDEDEHTEEEDNDQGDEEEGEEGMSEGEEGEDGDSHSPLLPIFSAAHLGWHFYYPHTMKKFPFMPCCYENLLTISAAQMPCQYTTLRTRFESSLSQGPKRH